VIGRRLVAGLVALVVAVAPSIVDVQRAVGVPLPSLGDPAAVVPASAPAAVAPPVVMAPVTSSGPTVLNGVTISADTTWGPTGSPYVISSGLTCPAGPNQMTCVTRSAAEGAVTSLAFGVGFKILGKAASTIAGEVKAARAAANQAADASRARSVIDETATGRPRTVPETPSPKEAPTARPKAEAPEGSAPPKPGVAAKTDVGLSTRGLSPAAGTRIRPAGIPDAWRVTGTKSPGGVLYRDPANAGDSVRVMQGNPNSPFPNSQGPYVRWQKNGQPLDQFGNQLPSAKVPEAHIPLSEFRFLPEVFG